MRRRRFRSAARSAGRPGRRAPGGLTRRPPGEPAVGRCAHRQQVAEPVVVPLRVAISVMRAGGPVVAGDPALVEGAAAHGCDRDGIGEGSAAVRRSAHQDRRAADGGVERERDHEPDVVHRVIGDGRVADARIRPALVDRGPGQRVLRPPGACIERRRRDDVARATVEEPPALEGGDDRIALAKGVRLDLRLVHARGVRVRVGADRAVRAARRGDSRRDQCERAEYGGALRAGSSSASPDRFPSQRADLTPRFTVYKAGGAAVFARARNAVGRFAVGVEGETIREPP